MSRSNFIVTSILGLAVSAVPVAAQSEESLAKNEVSVQAFGSFVKSTTSSGVDNSATNSGGVLGTYRYFFNLHNGIEANYGYSLNTQNYGLGAGPLGVKTYSHEATAAYVFRAPMRHFTPFVLAGVGGLVFDPKDFAAASTQARAAFVYGGGADFNLSHGFFMRAEYRGLVYNSPTYDLPALAGVDRTTHRAEPSIGFGYRF
jgi:opacity protein-like surface antigen